MKDKQAKIEIEVDKYGYTPDSCMYKAYERDKVECKDVHLTVQGQSDDLDIYSIINRHTRQTGIDITKLTPEQYSSLYPSSYADVSEALDYTERYAYLKEMVNDTMEKWHALPEDIRNYFGNSPENMHEVMNDEVEVQKFQEYLKRQNEAKSEVKNTEKVD